MKIYDGFIFNSELELLELRLNFLDDIVDYFIIVESERTLSGLPKPLHFSENKDKFQRFLPKIIHVVAPANSLPSWEYEYFQRNCIKNGLNLCNDNDLIFISDVDEILNIKEILKYENLQLPCLIELPMYYYFFNLRSNVTFKVNLAAPCFFIKDKDIGKRYLNYAEFTKNVIGTAEINTGWHFSFLFGFDLERYLQKIVAFSHQEHNTAYFLNKNRILKCITLGIDFFERPEMQFKFTKKGIEAILPSIKQLHLTRYIYSPSVKDYLSFPNLLFLMHRKYYRRIKAAVKKLFHID